MGKATVCMTDKAKEWKTQGSVRGTKQEQKDRRRMKERSNKQIRNTRKWGERKMRYACKYRRR